MSERQDGRRWRVEGRKERKLKYGEGEKVIRKRGESKMRQKTKPSTTCSFEDQTALIQLSMQCVQIDS